MLTTMDKAWVAGLFTWFGNYLSTKFNLTFITPELIAAAVGVVTFWVPNKAPPT